MLRKLALSILILLSVVAILPFADSAARGLSRSVGMQSGIIVATRADGGVAIEPTCVAGRWR